MKSLRTAVATSLLMFNLSACAIGFGDQPSPEAVPMPPYAYPYPYPPMSYNPSAYYGVPPPVAFGFDFGGRGEHFEHGGYFAHGGHFGGHGGNHHG